MKFDTDYVVNILHNCAINFSYDGDGNYTINQKDIGKLLEKQHKDTAKSIAKQIEKLIETDKMCVGIVYAQKCWSIVNKLLN